MCARQQRVTDEEIITVFSEIDQPVLTTKEVAEQLPIQNRATYNRLQQLHEEGRIQQKMVGARGAVWWPSDLVFGRSEELDTTTAPRQITFDTQPYSKEKQRTAASKTAVRYLKENTPVSRKEFIAELYPNHPAGFENERAWWEQLIRPNLSKLDTVKKPNRGGAWKYIDNSD